MPKKCCGKGCKTNYASEKAKGVKKVSVFRFPSAKKEHDARKKWIQAIKDHMNNNSDLHVTENSVVCEKHWPFGYPTCHKNGHERPAEPPSVFGNVEEVHKLSFEYRNRTPDKLEMLKGQF